jgi:hypothetical protein
MTRPPDSVEYFTEQLEDILPKSAHRHIPAIVELFDEDDIYEVHVVGAHIAVEWRTFGEVTVGLDVCGNAVTVLFEDRVEVV